MLHYETTLNRVNKKGVLEQIVKPPFANVNWCDDELSQSVTGLDK